MNTTTRPRRRLLGALAAGAVLVAAALLWATAALALPGPRGKVTQFTVFEPFDAGVNHEIDGGEEGFGPGDVLLDHHPLLDPATGEELGVLSRHTVIADVGDDGDVLVIVQADLRLPEGYLGYQGTVWYSEVEAGTATGPVIGGTGAYAHTSGTVTGRFDTLDGRDGMYLTFDVTRDRRP